MFSHERASEIKRETCETLLASAGAAVRLQEKQVLLKNREVNSSSKLYRELQKHTTNTRHHMKEWEEKKREKQKQSEVLDDDMRHAKRRSTQKLNTVSHFLLKKHRNS